MNDLTGKVALVTGSSRGIGRAIALKLAARGAKVIFHGVTISEKLRSAVQAAGDQAEMITADFSDPAAVKKMADEIKQRDLSPDILVLNASVQSYTGLHNFSSEEFQLMFRTNVESCCILLHEFIPQMRKKLSGRVIFIGSINGVKPASRLAVYGAAKAALMNIAHTAAKENADCNIAVNTILPGVIETDRNEEVLKNPVFVKKLQEEIPMHRFGTADECAELAVFLASDIAGYITGNDISISGGWQL